MQRDVLKQKSEENWVSGEICLSNELYNAAANRFYYSFYQAVRFWADRDDRIKCTESPRAIHEVCKNLLSRWLTDHQQIGEAFNEMGSLRATADYELAHVKAEDLSPEFLEEVQRCIEILSHEIK